MNSHLNYIAAKTRIDDRVRAADQARLAAAREREWSARRGWGVLASRTRVRPGARVPSVEEC
jgi:hypothetical protein